MKQTRKYEIDLSLYLVLDPTILCYVGTEKIGIEALLDQAIQGGVTTVQLREKNCSNQDFLDLIKKTQPILERYQIPLIINDRVDLALRFNAQSIHLGQTDLPVSEARKILGTQATIGLSVENHAQALEAEKEDVDYLGVSSVFCTASKPELTLPWGIQGLMELKTYSRHPLVGIGGIDTSNAHQVLEAGANGIAVISAITSTHPRTSAEALRNIVNRPQKKTSCHPNSNKNGFPYSHNKHEHS